MAKTKKKISKSPAEIQQFKSETGAKPTGVTDKAYGDIPAGKIVSSSPGAATRESPEISVEDRGMRQTRGAEPTVQPMFQQPVSVQEPQTGYQPSAEAYNTEILPPEDLEFHEEEEEEDAALAVEEVEAEAEEKGVTDQQLQTDTVNTVNRMETDPGYEDELKNKDPQDMSLGEKLAVILVSMGAGTILGEKTLDGDGTTGFLIGGAGGFGGVREQDIAEAKRRERQRDRDHDFAKMAQKQQQATKLQRVQGRVGDQAVFANYNPTTGAFTDPESGQDISGDFEPLILEQPFTRSDTGEVLYLDRATGTVRPIDETQVTKDGMIKKTPKTGKELDPSTGEFKDVPVQKVSVKSGLGLESSGETYRGSTQEDYVIAGLAIPKEHIPAVNQKFPGIADQILAAKPKRAESLRKQVNNWLKAHIAKGDKEAENKRKAEEAIKKEQRQQDFWEEREKQKEAARLKREEAKAAAKAKKEAEDAKKKGKPVNEADSKIISTLATKTPKVVELRNSLAAEVETYKKHLKAGNTDLAIITGKNMVKKLNSDVGADAVGAEEAKRLAAFLDYQVLNFTGPGPMFGRNLQAFQTQIEDKVKVMDAVIAQNATTMYDLGGSKTYIPTIKSKAQFKALPDNTLFRTKQGIRRKQGNSFVEVE
jgi:hypothetical protein